MRAERLLERPFGTLPALVRAHAAEEPSRTAVWREGRAVSYAELDALADRVAAALERDGIVPRDAVAVCAPNSVEWIAALLGVLRRGAVAVPLPPAFAAESLARMVADSGARLVLADGATAKAFAGLRAPPAAPSILVEGDGPAPLLEAWLAPAGAPVTPVDVEPGWPVNLIYSSGTTGVPKGVAQPQSMRWAHLQRGALLGYGRDAVTMIALPLWSNTTLVSFFPALGYGGTLVLMSRFETGWFLDLAQRYRATHAMLVPTLFHRLMADPAFDRSDLSSFRMKTCTSAPFPAALKADVVRRWPGELVEFYGMTEGGASCMLSARARPDKLHTVGQPQPGHEIRLISEDGREVAPGETGEVVGRSPMMMSGYHGLPDATAAAEWYDSEGRRFIRTGDLGRLDADGFLELLDRKKDLIISGGANVYPSDLEAVLRDHPDVSEVAVVGVPSDRWGESPVAFIVPTAEAGVSAQALQEWVNARVGKMQRVAHVEIMEALPRGSVGKVLKRELRRQLLERVRTLP